ncbi:MAG: hypothetical protein QF704_16690, partial [Anaerolineales bacterium]|nr:hypothetical protein [Anaerolineales bacterium]
MLTAQSSLAEWLAYIQQLHPINIDLGLDRLKAVASRLEIKLPKYNIVIGGTNGKGSCVAFLQYSLLLVGKKVSAYTSPHIVDYNERMVVNGKTVTDKQIVAAFCKIE